MPTTNEQRSQMAVQKQRREMAQPELKIDLRAVTYREGSDWIAHCLELDIVAEGKTPMEALRNLRDLCQLQVRVAMEEGDISSVFRAAPPEIWKMYSLGDELDSPKPTKPVTRFEARELALA